MCRFLNGDGRNCTGTKERYSTGKARLLSASGGHFSWRNARRMDVFELGIEICRGFQSQCQSCFVFLGALIPNLVRAETRPERPSFDHANGKNYCASKPECNAERTRLGLRWFLKWSIRTRGPICAIRMPADLRTFREPRICRRVCGSCRARC